MKKDNELSVQTKVLIWITLVIAIISIVYCGYLLYNVLSKKEAKEPAPPTTPVVEVKNPLDKIEDFYGYQELKDVFEFKAAEKEVPTCHECTGRHLGNSGYEVDQVCLENNRLVVKNNKNHVLNKSVIIDDVKSFIVFGNEDYYEQTYLFLKNNGDLYTAIITDSAEVYYDKKGSEIEKMTLYYRWDDGPGYEVLVYKKGKPYQTVANRDISSTVFEDKREGIATGFCGPFILLNRELATYGISLFNHQRILDDDQEIIKVKTAFTDVNAESMGPETEFKYERYYAECEGNLYIITQKQELYKFNLDDDSKVKVTDKKVASYKFIGNGGKVVQLGAQAGDLRNALVIKETGSMEITYTDGTTETITGINFRI